MLSKLKLSYEFIMRQVPEVEKLILDLLKTQSTCKQKYSLSTIIQNRDKDKDRQRLEPAITHSVIDRSLLQELDNIEIYY